MRSQRMLSLKIISIKIGIFIIVTTSEGRQVANVATLEDVKIHCQPAQRAAGHCHCYFGPLMTSINSSWKYSDVNQKIPLNCKDVIAMSTD